MLAHLGSSRLQNTTRNAVSWQRVLAPFDSHIDIRGAVARCVTTVRTRVTVAEGTAAPGG